MARQETPPDTEGNTDLGGMFYPVDHIVAAFPNEDAAHEGERALRQQGLGGDACRFFDGPAYATMARKELAQNTGFLATLGKTDMVVKRGLEAANTGAAFLLIHVPHNEDAVRAMRALEGVPVEWAYRYHSLAIEELKT